MRIKVNKRYYFTANFGEGISFGYFIKYRNPLGWDHGEKRGEYIPLRYRMKIYHSQPRYLRPSKKDPNKTIGHCDYVVSGDIKGINIITRKQFGNYMVLYGPHWEQNGNW